MSGGRGNAWIVSENAWTLVQNAFRYLVKMPTFWVKMPTFWAKMLTFSVKMSKFLVKMFRFLVETLHKIFTLINARLLPGADIPIDGPPIEDDVSAAYLHKIEKGDGDSFCSPDPSFG